MLWVRRWHMYSSLILLPWVILYACTAFLFNHPTFFGDAPFVAYSASDLQGTPLEKKVDLKELAQKVVQSWEANQESKGRMKLTDTIEPRYSRDFAFATSKKDGVETNILLDVMGNHGTVRTQPPVQVKKETPAPFAIGKGTSTFPPRGNPGASRPVASAEKIGLPDGLHERFLKALPTILEKTRMPLGSLVVTSVPDLIFSVDYDNQSWQVQFNPMLGSLDGKLLTELQPGQLSWRRFFLRLHTLHGYNGGIGPRWVWALLVDLVSITMLYWVASGLWMWWQMRSARKLGAILLLSGFFLVTWLATGLHAFFLIPPAR